MECGPRSSVLLWDSHQPGSGRLMRDLLYEIRPLDPVFMLPLPQYFSTRRRSQVVPARRASHLDPMQALRAE
jgi:ABC-type lipoprotein release transport system permease subunit